MLSSNLISSAINLAQSNWFLRKNVIGELRATLKKYETSWHFFPKKERVIAKNHMKNS
jgi:hypothetical protein